MFSGRFVILLGLLGVLLALTGHFTQSSILGHHKQYRAPDSTGTGQQIQQDDRQIIGDSEQVRPKTISFIRAINPFRGTPEKNPECKFCDGFTEEQCLGVCQYYGLTKHECVPCMCLCSNGE